MKLPLPLWREFKPRNRLGQNPKQTEAEKLLFDTIDQLQQMSEYSMRVAVVALWIGLAHTINAILGDGSLLVAIKQWLRTFLQLP
jgi:hypothetical protein